jgi:hypothetical protein
MPTRVRFRFNKVTGEVEEFLVDDQDRRLPEVEHDRIASEVGRLVAVNPRIREAVGAPSEPRGAPQTTEERAPSEAERAPEAPPRPEVE